SSLVSTPPSDWTYLAEGGASLVCAYRDHQEQYTGKVLRLPKRRRPAQGTDALAWQKEVIGRLLPEEVLPQLELVHLDSGWLRALVEHVEPARPTFRRADGIDINASTGILATDLIGGETIAVEIKPKWGFLPSPLHLRPSTAAVKTSYCRYCMHKHLRSLPSPAQPEGAYVPAYCPLDLYSGQEGRVRRALGRLWGDWKATQGGVNNFRVFVRGQRVDPADVCALLSSLWSCLTRVQPASLALLAAVLSAPDAKRALIDRLLPLLLASPILPTLRELQRTLDPLDIEGLSSLSHSLHPDLPLGTGQLQPDMREWTEFVDAYLAGRVPECGEERLRYYVLAYTLGATFKDCSLIVRLPLARGADTAGETQQLQGVWVIDTGVKDVGKLAKWEELDREIVAAFVTSGSGERCVE
ncbi:hypothetical protein CALVIDRAFT_464456, partial [Calocera viscosa TUFC12733]